MLNWWNEKTGRDDGNLIFVLLFLFFAVGIVIAVTATVISSSKKTSFANNYTVSRTWADSGINNAIWTLNNPGQIDPTVAEYLSYPDAKTSAEAVAPFNENVDILGKPGLKQGCTKLDASRYVCWRWTIPLRTKEVPVTDNDGNPVLDGNGEQVYKSVEIPGMPPEGTNQYMVYSDAWIQDTPDLPDLSSGEYTFDNIPVPKTNSYRKVQALLNGVSTVAQGSEASVAPAKLGATDGGIGGGKVVEGRIVYDPAPPSTLTTALWTRSAAMLNGSARVSSYNSETGSTSTPTGHGVVASGGSVNVDGSASADRIRLYGADVKDFNDRCQGPLCSNSIVLDQTAYAQREATAKEDLSTAFILDAVANGDGVTATSGSISYSTLGDDVLASPVYRVDGDLIIPSDAQIDVSTGITPDNPVRIYVTGDLVIGPGSQINMPTSDSENPVPGKLAFYVAGDAVSVGGAAATTNVAATLYAPRAACSSGSSAAAVNWYGSLACDTFSSNAAAGEQGWSIYYDDNLGGAYAGLETPEFRNVWSQSNVIERTPGGTDESQVDPNPPSQLPNFTVECELEECTITVEPQAGVTSYDMYRHIGEPNDNVQPQFVQPIFNTITVDRFLAPGTRYEYTLYPKNAYGIGPSSSRVGATMPNKADINLLGCTETTCDLEWEKFVTDGSAFQYTLDRIPLETEQVVNLMTNREGVYELTDGLDNNALEPGTEYEYVIYSRTAVVDGQKTGGYTYSKNSETNSVIALTLPEAPVIENGDCTTLACSFDWKQVKSATSYDIYRQNDLGQAILIDTVQVAEGTEIGDVISYVDNDPSIDSNKKYYYSITARNRTGPSQASNILALMTLPLPANTGLAVCEETGCDLTWNPNNTIGTSVDDLYGILTYDLSYRLPNEIDPADETDGWRPISSTLTEPKYSKDTLNGGTYYEFSVFSKNTAGDSETYSFFGLTKPEAPEPDADCSEDQTCVVFWDPVKSVEKIDPDVAAGYRVERHTYGDNEFVDGKITDIKKWVPVEAPVTLNAEGKFSVTDSTLEPGMKYEFRVYAFNASGDSLPGYVGAVALPKKIIPLVDCGAMPRECRLSWDSRGSFVTHYDVWRAFPGQPLEIIWTVNAGQFESITDPLNAARALVGAATFNLATTEAADPADPDAVAKATAELDQANAALAAAQTAFDDGLQVIRDEIAAAQEEYDAAVAAGDDAAADEARLKIDTGEKNLKSLQFLNGTPLYVDEGLLDGTDYVYAVTANAGYGDSKKVEVPALTVPAAPELDGPVVCADTTCTLSYTKPKSTTYFSPASNTVEVQDKVTTTTAEIVNLEPGATVTLYVYACNTTGCGDPLYVSAATRPRGPTIIGENGWLEMVNEFTVQTPIGNMDNPTQIWRCSEPGVCDKTDLFIGPVGSDNSYIDSSLTTPNVKYCYTAVNESGESVMSCKFTPPVAPVVTGLDISGGGNFLPGDSLRVLGPTNTFVQMFTPERDANGEPIKDDRGVTLGSVVTQMDRKTTNQKDGITVNGLKGNTEYCFVLHNAASDDSGDPLTDIAPYYSQETCAWTAPDAPTELTATRAANGKADLNWVAPEGEILDYIIEYKLINDSSWAEYPHAQSTETYLQVDNLKSAATYQFRVRAVNPGGAISAPSNIAIYEAAATPGKVTNLTAKQIQTISGTGGTVTAYTSSGTPYIVHTFDEAGTFTRQGDKNNVFLQWRAPADNGGAPIKNYKVEYRIVGDPTWTTYAHPESDQTFITVEGLPITHTYEFQVRAVNVVGEGIVSDPATQRVNFPVQYLVKGKDSTFTISDPVVNPTVATDICPAGTDRQADGSCREYLPGSQQWKQTGWSCNAGDTNYNNGTCRHSQGYWETYQSGTETYKCGSHCENTTHTGGASCVAADPPPPFGSGACRQWACPSGWSLSGTTCYITVCDRWVDDMCTRPTYAQRWIDTSYNYDAGVIMGWVDDAPPAGYNGSYPTWWRNDWFKAIDMNAATGEASPDGIPQKGGGSGDPNTYTAGSVTVRYEAPYAGASAVRNLAASMNDRITGGNEATVGGKTVRTFTQNGTLTVTPGDTATLTWDAPADVSRGAILDYRVEYRLKGATGWTFAPHGTSTATTASIPNLVRGAEYEFQVTPVTQFGLGDSALANVNARQITVEIVGAGGGGGVGAGGGGGAGGYKTLTFNVPNATRSYPVTVGVGGASGQNGTGSSFDTFAVSGGGAGGSNQGAGANGASGGGGSYVGAGGTGIAGEGFDGSRGAGGGFPYAGGGGGGGMGGAAPDAGAGSWSTPYTYHQNWECIRSHWEERGGMVPGCTWYPDRGTSGCTVCDASGWVNYKDGPPAGYMDPNDGTGNYYRIAGVSPGGPGKPSIITGQILGVGGEGASERNGTQGAAGAANTGSGGSGSASGKAGGRGADGAVIVGYNPTSAPPQIQATGGSISTATIDGVKYKIHTFSNVNQVENFTITSGSDTVRYLVLGGGGGGGGRNYPNDLASGGGGAGGVVTGSLNMSASVTPIVVGNGGSGGAGTTAGSSGGNGGSSSFGDIVAFGGGGGARPGLNGSPGGSGGGGAQYDSGSVGGSPLGIGQGNNGATIAIDAISAGGGGGKGGRGTDDGYGGPGIDLNVTGTVKTYAVGGNAGNVAEGGKGAPQTGNGGKGGMGTTAGQSGGSGLVVIYYPTN